AFGRTSEELA
ncbi:unnamed protein product, partial [Adineta ricciae]